MSDRRIKEVTRALWVAYPAPTRIRWLINTARYDLYYGPVPEGEDFDGEPYPGFTRALDELAAWFDAHVPAPLWYDQDSGEILEHEPGACEADDESMVPVLESFQRVNDPRGLMLGILAEYL